MSENTYSVFITAYDYDVLRKNKLIDICCTKQLESAIKHDDEQIELVMTLEKLTDLIGYVAAEANHARSKRLHHDLNEICDYLESTEQSIKNQKR